jgi:hypothetical protein
MIEFLVYLVLAQAAPTGIPVQCDSHEKIVAWLETHKEKLIYQGLEDSVEGKNTVIVEHFMSKPVDGKNTWTILRTSIVKDGTIACIVSTGTAWEQVDDFDVRT